MAGEIFHHAGSTPPLGALVCNGALISRTSYATLFAAIGTTYGPGDGTTTFQLPDLRGEFLRGLDGGRGVDAGRSMGSAQADAVKMHDHDLEVRTDGNAITTVSSGIAGAQGVMGGGSWARANQYTAKSALAGSPVAAQLASENRPRNIALLPCISYL